MPLDRPLFRFGVDLALKDGEATTALNPGEASHQKAKAAVTQALGRKALRGG